MKSFFTAIIAAAMIFSAGLIPSVAPAARSQHLRPRQTPSVFRQASGGALTASSPVLEQDGEEPLLPFYAEITGGCVLYSDESLTNAVTSLPPTYFVMVYKVLPSAYQVSYKNLDGYINRGDVSAVDFTPKTKFASSFLTLSNDGLHINIRSAPDHNADNIVARLTHGATLYYYGTVSGTTQNQLIGDKWYCVQLSEGGYGYVYAMYADAAPIPDNVIEPEPPSENVTVSPDVSAGGNREYFFIAALCIPVIIFCYLLFKPRPDSGARS